MDRAKRGGPLRVAFAGLACMSMAVPALAGPGPLVAEAAMEVELIQLAQSADQLPRPMRRALIVGIQEELNNRGYDAGPVDGIAGARTRTAIRSYQRDAGLPVDGVPSKELLDHLKFARSAGNAPTTAGRGTLQESPRRGAATSAGSEVRDLVLSVQRELQVRGYYDGALDGIAGPNTRAAVRAFQRDAGFPVTGEVDERLLAELRAVDPNIRAGRRS